MSEKKKVHWSKSVLELIIIWQLLPFAFFSSSCIIYRLAFSHRQFHCLNHRKTDEEKNQFLFYLQATTAPECWMCKQWPELFSLPRSLSRQHVYYFLPWRKQERERAREKNWSEWANVSTTVQCGLDWVKSFSLSRCLFVVVVRFSNVLFFGISWRFFSLLPPFQLSLFLSRT